MVKVKKTWRYRGVRKREWGTWVTEIREPQIGKRIWLGSFATPEMAARAHDVASYCLKGDKALLHFPQNIDKYPRPRSTSPHDIRAAAAEAAAMNFNNDQGSSNKMDNGDDFWNEIDLPELVDLI